MWGLCADAGGAVLPFRAKDHGDAPSLRNSVRRARRGKAEAELLELDLRGLRELLGKTQDEVAELIERSQGQVSETERRQDVRLPSRAKRSGYVHGPWAG